MTDTNDSVFGAKGHYENLLALLEEQVATLQGSLSAGGDEQYAAELCFDTNLVEVATRAIESVNIHISEEASRTSWYWRGENGEISAEEATRNGVLDDRATNRYVTDPLQQSY